MTTRSAAAVAMALRGLMTCCAVVLPACSLAQTNLWLGFQSPATNASHNAAYGARLSFLPEGMAFDAVVTSGTSIVPQDHVVSLATGTNLTVALFPLPHRSGRVAVEVTGTLGSWTSTVPFEVWFQPCETLVMTPAFSSPATNTAPGMPFTGQVAFAPTSTVFSLEVTSGSSILESNAVSRLDDSLVQVILEPKPSKSGWVSARLTGQTDCFTNVLAFDVLLQSRPPVIGPIADVTMQEDGTHTVSFSVSDADSNENGLEISVTSGNPGLIATSDMSLGGSGGSRTLLLDPRPDENGSAVITLHVSDGFTTVSRSFTLVVQPVNDPPALGGTSNRSTTDVTAITPFTSATVGDADQGKPSNEHLDLLVVLSAPGGGMAPVHARFEGDAVSYAASSLVPADMTSMLRSLVVYPVPNVVPPGSSTEVIATISVSDAGYSVSAAITLTITSVNDAPSVTAGLDPVQMTEGQTVRPFVLDAIADPDFGDASFTLQIERADGGPAALGSFSGPTSHGPATVAALQEFAANLGFTAASGVMTNVMETLQFRFRVTDGFGGSSSVLRSLTLYQVQNPPEISGVAVQTVNVSDRPVPMTPFPTIYVRDPDMNGAQLLDATLSQSAPSLGTFSQSQFTSLTPPQLTALLRSVQYTPTPGAIPINSSASSRLTVTVTDSSGLGAQNNNLTVHVTSVNNPPQILNVPPADQQPVLIPPVAPLLPFAGLGLSSDDPHSVLFTIALDEAAKGSLGNLGSFAAVSPGVYQMSGSAAGIVASLTNLVYTLSGSYNFAADDPGGTTFTLTARDFALLTTTRTFSIQVQDRPRNHLVARSQDDGLPGSLSHALLHAGNNDVITFALPAYPATIRPAGASPWVLSRNVTIKGPGANLLTLSGDANGDNTPDRQLFRVASRVTIEGVTLARATAGYGGAIAVQGGGNLTLRQCAVVDCRATYYGGAIDVDGGQLVLDGCFIGRNAVDAATGLGGGGVSVYSDLPVTIRNTTFSGNAQSNDMGDGGGALVIENVTSGLPVTASLTHCTFADNTDAAGQASAVFVIGFGTRVCPQYCLFADFSGRNLHVAGAGEFQSLGANVCDDSTRTLIAQQGQSEEVYLLDHISDLTETDPLLDSLAAGGEPTPCHGLREGSPAIELGLQSPLSVDQRGVVRVGVPDAGAVEHNALRRLVISEIQFNGGTVDFVELFVPRHATPLDLAPYALFIDGVRAHAFADGVIVGTNAHFSAGDPAATLVNPGFGLVVAFTNAPVALTGGANLTPVVAPSLPAAPGSLGPRGEIAVGVGGSQQPIARQSYLGAYLDPADGTSLLDTAANSIALAPQARGFALVPHCFVLPGPLEGADPSAAPSVNPDSPGADVGGTPFGQDNAEPMAVGDTFTITEDDASLLHVLANDYDSDGNDRPVIVDVSTTSGAGGDAASTLSQLGAAVTILSPTAPLRGSSIRFDAASAAALQQLPAGVEAIDSFFYEIIDVGFGPVEAYGLLDSNTTVTAVRHRLTTGEGVTITGSSVASYNGSFAVTVVDADTFTIPVNYTGPAASRGTWMAAAPRAPSSRDEALATVRVIGVNDPPAGGHDTVTNVTEASTVRVMVRPEFAGMPLVFPGDPVPAPVASRQNLLANDDDMDADDTWQTLRVVGVLGGVQTIADYSGVPGTMPVTVHAPGHGLTTGRRILLANYGGHASYNGYHEVTVLDADTFTIPRYFADNHADKGAWAFLDDATRYAAVTPAGASVTLTLRGDPREDHVVYRAGVSAFLNGLAEGESHVDRFWYVVQDRHAAVGFVPVDVDVTGLNDVPMPQPDPGGLEPLLPLITAERPLEGILASGLDLLYALPSAASNRVDLHALDLGGMLTGTLVLRGFLSTDEETAIAVPFGTLLENDTDIDRMDVLDVVGADPVSRLSAAVAVAGGIVTYDPAPSSNLQALARAEMRIDTFRVVVSDGRPDGVATSLVAVLVVGVNDTPSARDDSRTTHEDAVLRFDPRVNDIEIDIDGAPPDDRLSIAPAIDVPNPGDADVSLTPSNAVHDATVSDLLNQLADWQSFTNAFDYTVTDNSLLFAVEDMFHVPAGTTGRVLDPLANDRDFTDAAGPLTITRVGPTLHGGLVSLTSNATRVVYSSPPGFAGDDTFRYTIRNPAGDCADGRVTIRSVVPQLNGILHAADDCFAVAAGESVVLDVMANDHMLPLSGGGLTLRRVVWSSVPGQPVLTNNTFRYAPAAVSDPLVFVYEVAGGGDSVAHARATVQIVERRGTLRVQDDRFSVLPASIGNTLDVLANDGLVTESTAAYRVAGILPTSLHGSLRISADGRRLLYTPDASFIGIAHAEYVITDQVGGTGTGTVVIAVGQIEAVPDFYKLEAVGPTPVALDVLGNDRLLPAGRGSLSITGVFPADGLSAPAIGSAVVSGGTNILFAASGTPGGRTYAYVVEDGGVPARCATGTVTIVSVGAGTYANPDSYRVRGGGAEYVLDVLANDRGYPVAGRIYSILSLGTGADAPNAGGIVRIENDRLVYTPATGFHGDESFAYVMSDAIGTDSTRVTVSVRRGDLVANSDSFRVFHEWDAAAGAATSFLLPVALNDRVQPPLGQVFRVAAIGVGAQAPDHGGTVTIESDGLTVRYRPAEVPAPEYVERFTYEISDGSDRRAACTVSVRVSNRTGYLVALTQADCFTVARDSVNNALAVLANDFVRPGRADGWSIRSVSAPSHGGTASVMAGVLRYTPAPGFVGVDQFSYGVSDGLGGTGSAAVLVTVGDLPLMPSRFVALSGTSANPLDVLGDDVLHPAHASDYRIGSVLGADMGGVLAVSGSNTVLYTPDPAYTGGYPYTETFRYTVPDDADGVVTGAASVVVHDAGCGRSSGRITVLVAGRNDPPWILNTSTNRTLTDKQTLAPFGGVTVVEVDRQLTEAVDVVVSLDDPVKGHLTQLGPFVDAGTGVYVLTNTTAAAATMAIRQLVFVPTENRITVPLSESVSFTIRVTDRKSAPVSDTATVLSVQAVNDPPVISGTRSGQRFYYKLTVQPFAGVTLDEVDDLTLQPLTVNVAIVEPTQGSLQNLGSFLSLGGGLYRATNLTAAAATQQLRAMEFSAGANVVPVGAAVTTHLVLTVDDRFAAPVIDAQTSVVALNAYGDKVRPSSDAALAEFGAAVGAIAQYAVVGAPRATLAGTDAGAAFVYRLVDGSTNDWEEWRQLLPATLVPGASFGRSVAIVDTTVAVGAPGQAAGGGQSGCVYLYRRDIGGTDNWGEWTRIIPTNAPGASRFGYSVALSGDLLAVGAPDATIAGGTAGAGAVFLFGRHQGGPNAWGEVARWSPGLTGSADADCGWSVSLCGDTLIAGAPRFNVDTGTALREGAAFQFERHQGGSNRWGLVQSVSALEVSLSSGFGWSVAVNGHRLAIGVPAMSVGAKSAAGRVYLYGRSAPPAAFAYLGQLNQASDTERNFGYSVALDEGRLFIGAPLNNDSINLGAAYLYDDRTHLGSGWLLVEKFKVPIGSTAYLFGRAVGLGQGTGIVGAPADAGSNRGSAFFYRFDCRALDGYPGLTVRQTWDVFNFGDAVGNVSNVISLWGGAADPDGDGASNDAEYAFGGDPNVAETGLGMLWIRPGDTGTWVLEYTRRSNDPALVFQLQAKESLAGAWLDAADLVLVENAVPLGSGAEQTTLLVAPPASPPVLFFRIRAAW